MVMVTHLGGGVSGFGIVRCLLRSVLMPGRGQGSGSSHLAVEVGQLVQAIEQASAIRGAEQLA
jgi:hypothetical protein